jgi:hypothetical protein
MKRIANSPEGIPTAANAKFTRSGPSHAVGAERRPSGLTDSRRALDQVEASAVRLVPRLSAVALPLPAATRYGPSADGVPFRTTGRHGVEDTANLCLPVHGSCEKVSHGRVVPDIDAPRR